MFHQDEGFEPMRKVLNISMGGMLVEKEPSENIKVGIGNIVKVSLCFENDDILIIECRILREQERSIAIKFDLLTPEQEKILQKYTH